MHRILLLMALIGLLTSCDKQDVVTPTPADNNFLFEATPAERPIDLTPAEWVLDTQLSDQFNASTISAAKWDKNPNDWGPWSWESENTYTKEGILHLRMEYEEHSARGMDMFYTSGIIRSLDTITYGYVEARMKGLPLYPTASPAFWLYSLGGELDKWGIRGIEEGDVRYTEVDVVELLQGNWNPATNDRFGPEIMDCNLHVVLIENGQEVRKRPREFPYLLKTEYAAPWDPRDDYHTYGADIAPDKITFYIDGIKIAEKENLYWHLPMHVTFSLGLRYPHVAYNNCPNGLWRCPVPGEATADGFPSEAKVDWVRCYRKK